MTNKTVATDLGTQIEQLVRNHLAGLRAGAIAAVERGLSAAQPSTAASVNRTTPSTTRKARAQRLPDAQRGADAIADLAERFYAVLSGIPGETMLVLAPKVGVSPRELLRPVANLKRDGRVRAVGERQRTRYFPMGAASASG